MGLKSATAADAAAIQAFFAKRPAGHATFRALADALAPFGPMQWVATKSRVAVLARTRFLWVPEAHLNGDILVRFLMPRPIDDRRVRNDETKARWSCRVTVQPGPIPPDFLCWFEAAYEADLEADEKPARRGPSFTAAADARRRASSPIAASVKRKSAKA